VWLESQMYLGWPNAVLCAAWVTETWPTEHDLGRVTSSVVWLA